MKNLKSALKISKWDDEDRLRYMYPNFIFNLKRKTIEDVFVKRPYKVLDEIIYGKGEVLILDKKYKIKDLPNPYFEELHYKIQPIIDNPKEYFYCGSCEEVKHIGNFEVLIGDLRFCEDCWEEIMNEDNYG